MFTELHLRHYGAAEFSREKFNPVKDVGAFKPLGGLWTSPVDSAFGWKQWCESEEFYVKNLEVWFDVAFRGRVLVVDSAADLAKLTWGKPIPLVNMQWPLFQPLLRDYDAFHLSTQGERATRYADKQNLYGWDCETVFVMNPDCLQPVTKPKPKQEEPGE